MVGTASGSGSHGTKTPPKGAGDPPSRGGTAGPFAAVTVLFFFWGFITVMNDVLIPFLKSSFELNYFQAGLVQFAFFGAFFVISLIYFTLSVSGGDPINRVGYQRTIVTALVICAAGCGLFSPAAASKSYVFFLGALFLLATGVTLLQIAANPYAAILGRPENASSRLNLAQGLNSLGTTIAPIAGGLLLYEVFAKDGEVTLDAIHVSADRELTERGRHVDLLLDVAHLTGVLHREVTVDQVRALAPEVAQRGLGKVQPGDVVGGLVLLARGRHEAMRRVA